MAARPGVNDLLAGTTHGCGTVWCLVAQIGVLVVICFMLNFLRLCRLCECLSSGCVAHAMCPVPYVLCVVLHFASCPIVLWSALLVVDTHVRTCDLNLAFINILSGVRKPCYYIGMVA